MKKVLVIVVTFNGMKWLDRCLGSVRSSETPADLYVVDNASADGSADFVEREYPEAVLVRNSENLGFTQANNVGFRYALENGYDFAYLLNQDAWIFPSTLGDLLKASDDKTVILSPEQKAADGVSYDKLFEKNVLSKITSIDGSVPRVMAAHWLVNLGILRKIGLFNPLFPIYGQDDNLCDRARYMGYKVRVVQGVSAIHDRLYREEPLERIVYRNYFTSSLVRLADPSRSYFLEILRVIPFTIVKTIKYKSFLPFRYLPKIFSSLSEVKSSRKNFS
jgi:GT2 family glycosyltransferase